jgi:hypothetical protein
MDLLTFVIVSAIFTVFGFVWGKSSYLSKNKITAIVASTMTSLEKDGYLKSKTINGEQHYVKWPKE